MLKKFFPLLLIICFTFFCNVFGQEKNAAKDSSNSYDKVDSAIYKVAKRNKLTYWLFSNLYETPSPNDNVVKPIQKPMNKDNLLRFKGKLIRNIRIKSLDPFGTEVEDTLLLRRGLLEDIGNTINVKTREKIIRNLLLFKEGDRLDPLKLRESERLLRRQEYIRDARIYLPAKANRKADSTDIIVVVQQRWSINAGFGLSTTASTFNISESNLFGTGNKIKQAGELDISTFKFTKWSGEFKDVNIKNTYIDVSLFYDVNPARYFRGASIDRTFFSPLTKWAGSASYIRFHENLEFIQSDGAILPAPLAYNKTDFWVGRSIPFSNAQDDASRSTSLVLGTRYVNTRFIEKPPIYIDSAQNYKRSDLYLLSLGFSSRRYYKDRKIFRFGNTEDVPEGRSFAVVTGFLKEAKEDFIYTGLRIASGQHIEGFGYVSASAEYGIFYNEFITQRGVFSIDGSYFSDLWNLGGKWNMRQFIYSRITNGLNRDLNEYITLNGGGTEGLYGFSSTRVGGKNKTIVKFESIIYTPFNFAGIQLAAVVFAGFGKIGKSFDAAITDKSLYQAYGLGFLIRKDNLVVNTIRVSVGFYPNIPYNSGTNYRFNPYSLSSLNLRDFDVSKPDLASYR